MRIGIVSWWFNRGQASVMRTMRAALDEAGHETHVLARPTAEDFERPSFVADDGVWAQPGITRASGSEIGDPEYLEWAAATGIDTALFFQNADFSGISALRRRGVTTIGTYMWESFVPAQVHTARAAFDRLFALNAPTAAMYRGLGFDDVMTVPFCALPSIAERAATAERRPGGSRFIFMAGYLRARKPLGAVIEAFRRGAPTDAILTVKSQIDVRPGDLLIPETAAELAPRYRDHPGTLDDLDSLDPRVRLVTGDLDEAEFIGELQRHDVVVGVSRWEGLGLHLFECDALGIPLLLNRMEPYLDFAATGGNCVLADSRVIGHRPSGIEVHEPDIDSMAGLFSELGAPAAPGAQRGSRAPHQRQWADFVSTVDELVTTARYPRP